MLELLCNRLELSVDSMEKPPVPTTTAKKTKIYDYLEALIADSQQKRIMIKEVVRNYLNENHWNLAAEGLDSLRSFLKGFLNGNK